MEHFKKFLMFQAMKVPTQIRSKLVKKKTNTIKKKNAKKDWRRAGKHALNQID
jgi:hypothetical protein